MHRRAKIEGGVNGIRRNSRELPGMNAGKTAKTQKTHARNSQCTPCAFHLSRFERKKFKCVLRTRADGPLTSIAATSETTRALMQGSLPVFEQSRKGATETVLGESSTSLFRIARWVSVQITPAQITHGACLLRYHGEDSGGGKTHEQPGNDMGRDGLCRCDQSVNRCVQQHCSAPQKIATNPLSVTVTDGSFSVPMSRRTFATLDKSTTPLLPTK